MRQLTVGFVFCKDLESVLLLHIQKPDWQVGKLNGLGGKVEPGETALEGVARECLEETCLNVTTSDWTHFATIKELGTDGKEKTVEFFTTRYSGNKTDAKKGDYEEIEWFYIDQLPENVIPNLHFLIPMAKQHLLGHGAREITIAY